LSEKSKEIREEKLFFKKVFLKFIWLFVFSGTVFGGYKFISQENVLPIKEIGISGEFNQLSARELHTLIVDGVSGNFFTLSVEKIYQQFYALPWVEKIWVHRVWPDKINIEIRENIAVAILKNRGLLNSAGTVFSADTIGFEDTLPTFFVANEYEQEAIAAYHRYDKILSQANVKIRQFIFDTRKAQRIILANGLALKLGRVETEYRLKRFIRAYTSNLLEKKNEIEGVDLRYTNGFSVKWKQA